MAVEIRAATYAGLRTALAAGTYQAGQVVFVESIDGTNTNGAGTFQVKYDAGGGFVDDGGVTITSADGKWAAVRDFDGPALARWWGAVGDGSTDDTTALQAAIDSQDDIALEGAHVVRQLSLSGKLRLALSAATGAQPSLILKAGSDTQLLSASSLSDLHFKGILFDGDADNQSTPANLLQFLSCSRVRFERCTVQNASQDGIYLSDCTDVEFSDGAIRDNTRNGFSCGAAVDISVRVSVERTSIVGHSASGSIGVSIEPAADSLIADCDFSNNDYGVVVSGHSGQSSACSGNVVRDSSFSASEAATAAITVSGAPANTDRNSVFRNTITGSYANGIVIVSSDAHTIERNSVIGLTGSGSGVALTTVSGSRVAENRVEESQLYGIIVTGGGSNSVIGNLCYDNSSADAGVRDGIRLTDTTGNHVQGNRSWGTNQAFGVRETGSCASNVYRDNRVDGNSSGGQSIVADAGSHVDRRLIATASPVVVTGTTSETDLQQTTLPANVHRAFTGVRVTLGGTKAGAAGNKQIKLHFGGSSITLIPAANNINDWRASVDMVFLNQTNQRVSAAGIDGTTLTQDYMSMAVDTGSAVVIKATASLGNSADTVTSMFFIAELIP